jgi:hypothetical protein
MFHDILFRYEYSLQRFYWLLKTLMVEQFRVRNLAERPTVLTDDDFYDSR